MSARKDPNRVIAVVTGANSGYGLGICQQLLSNLSLPSSIPMPASTPQPSALPPSLQHLIPSHPQPTKVSEPETTLTLVLACRSEVKAREARDILLKAHRKELAQRKKDGLWKEGWEEGLKIDWEGVDLDSPGGPGGILAFCDRLKSRYPHITSLFLNAGVGAYYGLDYWIFLAQILQEGMPLAMSQPNYNLEITGATSRDGERGLVWGTNVLGPYIMVIELIGMLRQSPPTLPFEPRVIYTSSGTALSSKLKPDPMDDYMLLSYDKSYGASKYMGDLVMLDLDQKYSATGKDGMERGVRVLTADPGCVATNFFNKGLGVWAWLANFKWVWYWLAFYLCRLLGSPYHPVYAKEGALPMIYAALIPSLYLLPGNQGPAQRFAVKAQRWGNTKVGYGEIDEWEKAEARGLPKAIVEKCEQVRLAWRKKETS